MPRFVVGYSTHRVAVNANVPNSPILIILMMEAIRSSETSVLTRAAQPPIPEDGINLISKAACENTRHLH
jgi:hypothetical protein